MDIAMDENFSPSKARIPFYKDWLLIPIIGLVYVLDQFTKHWVEEEICYGRCHPNRRHFPADLLLQHRHSLRAFP